MRIAEREYRSKDGNIIEVMVGAPVPAGHDWSCTVTISIDGTGKELQAVGVDTLQALVMAMRLLRLELDFLARTSGLEWAGGDGPAV